MRQRIWKSLQILLPKIYQENRHITKKDIRHSDGGIVLGNTALRNVEGDKYEIRSGRYRGKVAAPVKEDVVEGSIEEVSTARLKSYAEKAREDAEKLTKQGDRARSDTTKLNKYVKATKRHLNAHKADDKISSNEFYGKK